MAACTAPLTACAPSVVTIGTIRRACGRAVGPGSCKISPHCRSSPHMAFEKPPSSCVTLQTPASTLSRQDSCLLRFSRLQQPTRPLQLQRCRSKPCHPVMGSGPSPASRCLLHRRSTGRCLRLQSLEKSDAPRNALARRQAITSLCSKNWRPSKLRAATPSLQTLRWVNDS